MNKIAGASFFALTTAALALVGGTAANAVVGGPASDAYNGSQDTVLSVDFANGVFANDDCSGGVASLGFISNFVNGELDMHADGSFDYTPAAGYFGPRTFDYELLCDGVSAGSTTVNLVFSPHVPVGAADAYTTPQDTTLTVAPNGVLANDTAALTVMEVVNAPAGLTWQPDGSFVYAPPAGFVGDVSFSYRMSDGTDTFSDYIPVTISVTAVAQAIPADTDSDLPTLAYTGTDDVTAWLIAPALALLTIGGAAVWFTRRPARTN
jgi:hypothetical protein